MLMSMKRGRRRRRRRATPEQIENEKRAADLGKQAPGSTILRELKTGGTPECTPARVDALLRAFIECGRLHPIQGTQGTGGAPPRPYLSHWWKQVGRHIRADRLRWLDLLSKIARTPQPQNRPNDQRNRTQRANVRELLSVWRKFTTDLIPTEDLPTAAAQLDVVNEIVRRRRAIKAWNTRREAARAAKRLAAEKRSARSRKAWETRRAKAATLSDLGNLDQPAWQRVAQFVRQGEYDQAQQVIDHARD